MEREQIIRMAREAMQSDPMLIGGQYLTLEAGDLERLAALVAAAAKAEENEACAKVCESLFDLDDDSCDEAEKCAAAIRSRKENT